MQQLQTEPHAKFLHCFIHKQATAAKLEPEGHKVLQHVIDTVHFIKARALNSRISTIPCNEMRSDQESNIPTLRFASYLVANCLKDLLNLNMHYTFLSSSKTTSRFADLFCDDKQLAVVCYLADILKKLHT